MRANVPPLDQANVTDLHQFIVDVNAKIESERLHHLRVDNDKDLRATIVNQDGDLRIVGHKVILPATFCRGPR